MSVRNQLLVVGAILIGVVGAVAAVTQTAAQAEGADPVVTVYKRPSCGCCSKWVDHLREKGFQVEAREATDLAQIKNEHGVPDRLAGCHTAIVNGYVIEGHVPADVIRRFLAEQPEAAGLAVPGMPIGSPGMEIPNRPAESYDIFLFKRDGDTSVYASR